MTENFSESEANDGQELLACIGQTMTNWQGVEFAACEVYLSFFPITQRDVPMVGYHAIRAFDSRISMTEAIIKYFCTSSKIMEWNALRSRIRKLSKTRNAAAHGMAFMYGEFPNRKWRIGQSPYDIEDFNASSEKNSHLTSIDLNNSNKEIGLLTKDIDKFRASLEEDLTLQSKLLLQQNDVLANSRATKVTVHVQPKP